ncbi:unnamed protein product [Effrenium voratum]|nr:unnamed protein product [Effrenium voratum]CAJ1431236.1 unnamed protein product [Effrenium voratum]
MGQQCPCRELKDKDPQEAPGEGEVQAVAEEPPQQATKKAKEKDEGKPYECPWVLPPGGNLTVMMFGMTGAGKSALGNLIAGQQVFDSGDDTASITNLDSIMKYEAEDGSMVLLDTIGLGDTEIDQTKVVASIRDVALSAPNGVDCLLYVMRNARITDDAIARLIYVTEYLWGDESLLNLYIVVTCASKYANNREEADDWIKRQVEINWRFKHIYSIVGNNPHRFIFVDNPDVESVEPKIPERRRNSREQLYKLFCNHPREAIPPFSQVMMKQVAELTKAERAELAKKEKELRALQPAKASSKKKPSVTGVVPAEKKGPQEQAVKKAQEDLQKAQLAMLNRLAEVKSKPEFQQAAQQHAESATSRFMQDFKGESDKAKAASRMLSSLTKRLNISTGKDKTPEKKAKAPEPVGTLEDQVKMVLSKVKRANKETPAALFRSMGGWSGAGAITPMVFTSFLLKHCPEITQQQIGCLWWRADTNNDGQVDLQEFKDFFAKHVETAA